MERSTLLACVWPDGQVDGIDAAGLGRDDPKILPLLVWAYCIVWWLIQDVAKVGTYYLLEKYNVFGINDSLMIGKGTAEANDIESAEPTDRLLVSKLTNSGH